MSTAPLNSKLHQLKIWPSILNFGSVKQQHVVLLTLLNQPIGSLFSGRMVVEGRYGHQEILVPVPNCNSGDCALGTRRESLIQHKKTKIRGDMG